MFTVKSHLSQESGRQTRPNQQQAGTAWHGGGGDSETGELLTVCTPTAAATHAQEPHMHRRRQSRELKAKGQAHPSLPLCPPPHCVLPNLSVS